MASPASAYLAVAALVTTCVAPPAKPDDCRVAITVAYTRMTLAEIAGRAEWAAATFRTQPPADEQNLRDVRAIQTLPIRMASTYRDASVARCIDDRWSSRVTRCYLGAVSYDAVDACIRELSHDQCVKLDGDTQFETHRQGLGGGCGRKSYGRGH